MSEVVYKHVEDDVAVITLNRPQRLNAWTAEMEHLYFAMLDECAASPDVRVIVVTGAGRGFCAGADMSDLQSLGDGTLDEAAQAERHERRPQSLPLTIPKPIVAAINGAVRRDRPRTGADVRHPLRRRGRQVHDRVRAPRARRRARHVVDAAATGRPARALDLLLSGRVVLAEEAAAMGLVNRVVRPELLLEQTLEYARELAVSCSPASMATMKAQVYADLERDLATALARADELMLTSFTAPDFAGGRHELPRAA